MDSKVSGEDISQTFTELADLEKAFLEVEVDGLRRKENAMKPLFTKRQKLLNSIPRFWPIVFHNAPEEISQFLTSPDVEILSSLKSFSVERYQIKSETEGEPRSLRFTFEFEKNDFFEDAKLVKDLQWKSGDVEGFVSTPVNIKWKNKKADPTGGLLNAAFELYGGEQALQSGNDSAIDPAERESLWQNEKLRELLVKSEDAEEDLSFFCWFGFRGNVLGSETSEDEGSDEDDMAETMLDVEIFPPGEDLTLALVDDLWSNAPACFTEALMVDSIGSDEDMDDDESESEDEPPVLVPAETASPNKKRKLG